MNEAGSNLWRIIAIVAATGLALALLGSRSAAEGEVVEARNGNDTPVVLIVLDELPTASLMTADGKRINARRFPEIARFVSGATWYRDNVAAGDFTAWAVPGILTGNLVDGGTLPTAEAQPENFFTRLGPGRTVHSFEPLTELCPIELCPEGHQGETPDVGSAHDFILAKFGPFGPKEVKTWIRELPAGPGTLSFVHVLLPHQPFRFTPSGRLYRPGPLEMPADRRQNVWTTGQPAVTFVQARHLIQLGYADRLVGQIMDKIRENGDFDDSLIVLTADHGISFDAADLRRHAAASNLGATLNPPLIIKYPGQVNPVVSSRSTQSIDILPTIARQLGATLAATDGQPIDEATRNRVMTVGKDASRQIQVTASQIRADRRGVLRSQYRRLGNGDLWHLGPRRGLIGRQVRSAPALAGTRHVLYLSRARIRRADASDNVVPALVSGRLAGIRPGRFLALAWNGRIVGTTRTFRFRRKVQFGVMVPPRVMKKGRNRVTVLVNGRGGGLRRVPGR
ncbi:MAG: sulfatase-like hydrolase/transferase [Solirubrobacterales bacterium]|nr:sulfatase-like hydrolase/transferase [Solirubrobacterales bacterium]